MKNKVVILAAGVIVLFGGIAQGNLVSFSADKPSTWSPSGAIITRVISSLAPIDVTMIAEADSTFTIISGTTNESGFTWTGYILTLDTAGSATFVPGTASSTKFNTVVESLDHLALNFGPPGTVEPGQLVAFQFDLNIPEGLSYTFTLTQYPIPEPATFALLGLGSLALLAGRKR
ncbi:MAG: PEP-CTERM sorting domain-containing protein [Planctomycetota bacterium]|nr:PEP-CTERM sorting domain-containing protein [Planctomycetota bacterium]